MPIDIAVVDDHRLFREGICSILAAAPDLEIVAAVGRAHQAYSAVERTPVDVVLLDYVLPEVKGPTVAREILRRRAGVRILMLSMYDDKERVAQALDAGALGYASKDQSPEELIAAIRTVAGGEQYLAPSISRPDVEDCLRSSGHGARPVTPLAALTRREQDVFELTVKGLSNQKIAQHLGISRRTVETHRARVLHKLHVHSAAELAHFAARHGLLDR